MKTRYIEDNFFAEDNVSVKGLDQHSTISNGSDNGANNCMAGGFHRSMRHGTTRQAVDNLKGRLNSKPGALNIAGHGMAGSFETGAGQTGLDWDKQVNTWNTNMWKPILEELRGRSFPILTIYSCSTGAGEEGADLLWEMAKTINKPVRARTGLTYCGDNRITYQPGSTWQTAHPSQRPTPIPETPHKLIELRPKKIYIPGDEEHFKMVDHDEIVSATIQGTGVLLRNEPLDAETARKLAEVVFNESIQKSPGQVLGYLTITIAFEFETDGNKNTKTVDIYNNRVAVIRDENIMYALPAGFREIIGF